MWPPSLLAAKTTLGSRATGARDEIINSLLEGAFGASLREELEEWYTRLI